MHAVEHDGEAALPTSRPTSDSEEDDEEEQQEEDDERDDGGQSWVEEANQQRNYAEMRGSILEAVRDGGAEPRRRSARLRAC